GVRAHFQVAMPVLVQKDDTPRPIAVYVNLRAIKNILAWRTHLISNQRKHILSVANLFNSTMKSAIVTRTMETFYITFDKSSRFLIRELRGKLANAIFPLITYCGFYKRGYQGMLIVFQFGFPNWTLPINVYSPGSN